MTKEEFILKRDNIRKDINNDSDIKERDGLIKKLYELEDFYMESVGVLEKFINTHGSSYIMDIGYYFGEGDKRRKIEAEGIFDSFKVAEDGDVFLYIKLKENEENEEDVMSVNLKDLIKLEYSELL